MRAAGINFADLMARATRGSRASKAWDGQFTGEKPQESPDNLFETVEHLHSEKGPFSDRSIYKRPILWTVRNQNFWINETAILIAVVTFFFGLFLGYFGL